MTLPELFDACAARPFWAIFWGIVLAYCVQALARAIGGAIRG